MNNFKKPLNLGDKAYPQAFQSYAAKLPLVFKLLSRHLITLNQIQISLGRTECQTKLNRTTSMISPPVTDI